EVADISELQLYAEIGFVRTEAAHGLFPSHSRERFRQFDLLHLGKDMAQHAFEDLADLLLVQEGGFAVDLSEFRLTISTKVFVAEAIGDQVGAIKAEAHQQLREQRRRLR